MRVVTERLTATVERVTFHNSENGFTVLRARTRGGGQRITIVGNVPLVSEGEEVEALGRWVTDRVHGKQFAADEIRVDSPKGRHGIERYLASGVVRGVGPGLAKQLVAHFGTRVFEIIENEPSRLAEIGGIGPRRAQMIAMGWQSQKAVREIMIFLLSHGVGAARAMRIWRTWGDRAIPILKENPYRLADEIRGIGFATADKIAADLGVEKNSPHRLRAGVVYTLGLARGEGHCGLPFDELRSRSAKLLEVDLELAGEAILHEAEQRRIVVDDHEGGVFAFIPQLWNAESRAARRLLRLSAGAPPWRILDPELSIRNLESNSAVSLSLSQRHALTTILSSKLTVITGGPGVGKTTLVNAVLAVLESEQLEVTLAAPTGRAARRLTESTGLPAKTLHRLLEIDPQSGTFRRGADEPLEYDLVVVDEASMIDVPLLDALLQAIPDTSGLLIVGDVDQLPSVGPGQVLRDVIDSRAVTVVRLTEVFRQAAQSRIVIESHRVNEGQMPSLDRRSEGDFFFVRAPAPEDALSAIVRLVTERIPARFGLDPLRDIQVLTPMNRGGVGVASINDALQRIFHPAPSDVIERFGVRWLEGDKVMQLENDYDRDVFNGDVGIVRHIDADEGKIVVDFEGREAEYGSDDLDRLGHAYAMTIHKSQGSEYAAVVIPLLSQHHVMLQRNLLYTAITRGRKLVVLVGDPAAVATAVRNDRVRKRWTRLRTLLETGGREA